MQVRLSKLQQQTVWNGWLSAEIRASYFADLRHRYEQQQRVATWLTLISSSGAFLALMNDGPPASRTWVRVLFTAAATAFSLWSLVGQHPRRATDCADLHARWMKLSHQYRALWDDMYADEARARLDALMDQEAELSKSSSAFPNKPRLMLKWQAQVELHHASHPA